MKQIELLKNLEKYQDETINFKQASSYYWSPKERTVYYQENDNSEVGNWTLLHELSHGLLRHETYQSDYELVLLEVKAWEHAEKLAKELKIKIDDDHIQDCLDSYRDWQYKRSICPDCALGGVQVDTKTYSCLFCAKSWHVSESRFCRPYRRRAK